MVIAATVVSQYGSFFEARRCEDIDYMFFNFQNYTELLYPECTAWYSGANPHQYAVVQANLNGDPAQASTALNMSFTMAAWLSLAMHAIGVEVYVSCPWLVVSAPASAWSLGCVTMGRTLTDCRSCI